MVPAAVCILCATRRHMHERGSDVYVHMFRRSGGNLVVRAMDYESRETGSIEGE